VLPLSAEMDVGTSWIASSRRVALTVTVARFAGSPLSDAGCESNGDGQSQTFEAIFFI
jgi:hypothetical protein